MSDPRFRRIAWDAAERYRPAGRFATGFARGKLTRDPAFERMLAEGWLRDARRILDLGCGQGLLAALVASAQATAAAGRWPAEWASAPARDAHVRGIELMASDVARARQALGDDARIEQGDIATADFGQADVVVILDVLHYLPYEAQDDVLHRVRRALPAGGRLLLRVGDAAGGLGFRMSLWVDHAVTFCRGHRLSRLYCRPVGQWADSLRRLGFDTSSRPMSAGTPFANVLLVADC